ncbi:MAG: hypothetical protein HQL16_03810 [Candidatus Omnitrophica bacterium]|nr:hypothetical protein [Candidatus Omnitrophota bacterium]
MKKPHPHILTAREALQAYGGHVKYFESTEKLSDLLKLSGKKANNILACCASGDQALTLLGALKVSGFLYAFDANPAQLFLLAGKALFLADQKKSPFVSSFEDLEAKYPGVISRLPADLRRVDKLYNISKKKFQLMPEAFHQKFIFQSDNGMYSSRPPFWSNDKKFTSGIKANIHKLRFLHSDLFYVDQWFGRNSLDLIYLSDISLMAVTPFYMTKISSLVSLLTSEGIILGHSDNGEQYLSQGQSVIDVLRKKSKILGLEVFGNRGNLWGLRKKKNAVLAKKGMHGHD